MQRAQSLALIIRHLNTRVAQMICTKSQKSIYQRINAFGKKIQKALLILHSKMHAEVNAKYRLFFDNNASKHT
jgi:hypothetical protein